ncbi:MAG: threonine/serine exporter family protein, partial [Planctomycetia bacterium]|nr:threonine/serine exporter family protein [Planctomycetia bacterium]
MESAAPPPDTSTLLEFMFRLGQAYLACGEQTAKVELVLRRVATANGIRRSRVVAYPTALFIVVQASADGDERVTLAEGPLQVLRLDQIGDVYTLGETAQRGEVTPQDGLTQLNAILRKEPRFGSPGVVLGHTVLSIGLALVLMPLLINLAAAALLGTLVGALKLFNRDRPVLAVPAPVVAAALVAMLVFLAMRQGLAVDPEFALIPPLVAFLPGAMLTLGMVELAYGDMVSGSSRLITGFVQLVLLAFGL